jgi:hypothetical protein
MRGGYARSDIEVASKPELPGRVAQISPAPKKCPKGNPQMPSKIEIPITTN